VQAHCRGSQSFSARRSLITFSHLAKQNRSICKAESINIVYNFQRKFSSNEKTSPAQISNERQSLIDGEPSKELKQLSEDILNLNWIDMSILLDILQVSRYVFPVRCLRLLSNFSLS
jgi:hypothetical protein